MPRRGKCARGLNSCQPPQVIIVGAGIAGLTLSLALARQGLRSLILEARPVPSTDGAGIQLGPNATGILDRIGVLEALRVHAGQPTAVIVRRIADGRHIATLPLPAGQSASNPKPYLVVHRSALHEALLNAVNKSDDIEMRYGFQLQDIEQQSTHVTVSSAAGATVTGPVVVGCDGLWSQVRQGIAPDFQLTYSGMVAARAVLPINQAPASLQDPNTGVWLGPAAHIVKYPIDAGQRIAMVVVTREPQRLIGWENAVDHHDFRRRLPAQTPNLAALLKATSSWKQWALYDPPPLANWSSGRAIIIGDAAHPILPFLAQGGAMAIEDAFSLANLLARHNGPAAFPIFEQQRRERVTRVQMASRQNGQIYHLSGVAADMRDAAMRLVPSQRLMRRYDWIYNWQPLNSTSLS